MERVRGETTWPADTPSGIVTVNVPDPRPERRAFAIGVLVGMALILLGRATLDFLTSSAVTVRNGSKLPVHRVFVTGGGVWEQVGDLEPGASVTLRVHPRGEGGYTLTFMRQDGTFHEQGFGYFTGGRYGDAECEILPDVR